MFADFMIIIVINTSARQKFTFEKYAISTNITILPIKELYIQLYTLGIKTHKRASSKVL